MGLVLPTADDPACVLVGDALETLRRLPDGCVHACVTSPPYWSLRDYGTGRWEGGDTGCDHVKRNMVAAGMDGSTANSQRQGRTPPADILYSGTCGKCGAVRIDRQIGLEDTPAAFVARLVDVFREVRRVLHPSGVLFVNIGDSYFGGGGYSPGSPSNVNGSKQSTNRGSKVGVKVPAGLKPKDLCGVPWMLAFALRDDGWYLRSDIIWHKPSPMPESVTDRPTKSHEYVFLLTKNGTYFYDAEAVREAGSGVPWNSAKSTLAANGIKNVILNQTGQRQTAGADTFHPDENQTGRNKRTVWTIVSDPYPEAHFATFPPALVEPMVKAGSSERGVCPACWAPWVRVTSTTKLKRHRPNDLTKRTGENGTGNHCPNTVAGVRVTTTGWQPSCKCPPADPIPSLILDPFAGSGTTLAVAVKLKRRAVGIELNPEYAKLAEKRLAEPLGTGGLYDTGAPVVHTLFPEPM